MRILGIDPGSRITGWGLIEWRAPKFELIDFGTFNLGNGEMSDRLADLLKQIQYQLPILKPDLLAIEQVFVAKNISSSLKLMQARGVVLAAGAAFGAQVQEFTPRRIKQCIVGFGGAEKAQVNHMIAAMLKIEKKIPADAADALAVAICCAHALSGSGTMTQRKKTRGLRWDDRAIKRHTKGS